MRALYSIDVNVSGYYSLLDMNLALANCYIWIYGHNPHSIFVQLLIISPKQLIKNFMLSYISHISSAHHQRTVATVRCKLHTKILNSSISRGINASTNTCIIFMVLSSSHRSPRQGA